MTKLHEDTLVELWESVGEDPRRFVSAEEVKLTGSVGGLDLEFSSEAPLSYEMVVRGTIETPIKKEEEVMEDRLYKFSEIIQMLEEGALPEGTKITGKDYNKSLIVYEGMEGNCIEWSGGYTLNLQSGHISALYKIVKPSPKRYKAFHKVFTDYHGDPTTLYRRDNNSITLLDDSYGSGSGRYTNTFTMEELEAFPINLNDFNLEEVSTTV